MKTYRFLDRGVAADGRVGAAAAAVSQVGGFEVVRLADAKQMQLGHAAEADARWRIYVFAGRADSSHAGSAIHRLADWLETAPASPVVRHTRPGEDIDGIETALREAAREGGRASVREEVVRFYEHFHYTLALALQ